jgi:hypothetical protein
MCDSYIYDFIRSPLPLANPLRQHIHMPSLERCLDTIVESFKKASYDFTIVYPTEISEEVFWKALNLYLPENADEIKFAADVCTDASVARKTRDPTKVLTTFLNSKFYTLMQSVPQCHKDHINKISQENIGSLGPVPEWRIREIKAKALNPMLPNICLPDLRGPDIYS